MAARRRVQGLLAALTAGIVAAAASMEVEANDSQAPESELLAVLRSDASPADKAITCKRLAIVGSASSVPELAKLLPDPQLSSWARIALEAIPGAASNAALRDAVEQVEGRLLVGVINSLGVRRDVDAVKLLARRLNDPDPEVASAAAVALGKIGNAVAATSLSEALAGAAEESRSAVAEGLILCAEQLVSDDQAAAAVEIYDQVRTAEVPLQRVLEATRGAILARGPQGVPLLLEQLRSPDKKLLQIGLSTAREFPAGEVDEALAMEITRIAPERAALILQAMADRNQAGVLPAVLSAAGSGPSQVRAAAIAAIGQIG
ncbi:MAG: HEAT repeat domain-containing protein, partial [Planctomycetota bacterium]